LNKRAPGSSEDNVMRRFVLALGIASFLVACSAQTVGPGSASDGGVDDTAVEEDTSIAEEDTSVVEEDTRPADTRTPTDTRPPACIKPGAAGCMAYFDCCEAECQDGRCCKTRLQTGYVCGANAECCDGFCTAGKCCVPPGKRCTINSMCCSNWCGNKAVPAGDGGVTSVASVCCNPAGKTCATSDDCCSGSCVSGSCACLPSGAACPAYGDALCCGGACVYTSGVGYRCR